MLVIPAIDFSNGRLARLDAGGIVPVETFGGDPLTAARSFITDGAEWIHAVDLDLAFSGSTAGLGTFERLGALGVPLQASGGIRSAETARAVLASGADRVVVGSAALADVGEVEGLLREHGERVAVGLEVEAGALRPRGAPAREPLPDLGEVLAWLSGFGDVRVVLTSVGLVGSLRGPDRKALADVAGAGLRVILAGGVSSADDVRALASSADPPEAVILGRALYEGGLGLAEALAAAGALGPSL